jgi:hypothetical protein
MRGRRDRTLARLVDSPTRPKRRQCSARGRYLIRQRVPVAAPNEGGIAVPEEGGDRVCGQTGAKPPATGRCGLYGQAEQNEKKDCRADDDDDGDERAQGEAEALAGGAVELSCHDGTPFLRLIAPKYPPAAQKLQDARPRSVGTSDHRCVADPWPQAADILPTTEGRWILGC